MDLPEAPHLMIEFHGSDAAVAEQSERFGEIAQANGGQEFRWSTKEEERRALWALRHNAYYAIIALERGARGLVTDICVPISRLAEAVEETRADIAASRIQGPIVGHVGDGNFHAVLLVHPDRPEDLEEAKRLSHRMVERSLRFGGTCTGEHGVGMGKLDYMAAAHQGGWDVMSEIKRSLDPQGILNPGKVVRQN